MLDKAFTVIEACQVKVFLALPQQLAHLQVALVESELKRGLLEQVQRVLVNICLFEQELDKLGLSLLCTCVQQRVLVTKRYIDQGRLKLEHSLQSARDIKTKFKASFVRFYALRLQG